MPVKQRGVSADREYRRHADLVHDTARRFVWKYGGDYEEAFGNACLYFVRACGDYDGKDRPFGRYAKRKIWLGLLSRRRVEARRARLMPREEFRPEKLKTEDRPPGVEDVLAEMSEDAKEVVFLALYPPVDVTFAVAERGGKTPRNWRRAIAEYLQSVGWYKKRVYRAINEVRDAFSGGSKDD
jgi:hypothetical protein